LQPRSVSPSSYHPNLTP